MLFARVVPIARSIVSVPAGTAKMPLVRFIVLTGVGSAAWNALLIGAGVFLGANWEVVQGWIGSYSNAVLVAAFVGAAAYLLLRHFRRSEG